MTEPEPDLEPTGSRAGPTTQTAGGAPPVDLASFYQMMREAGIEEGVNSILVLFIEEAPTRMEALAGAAATGEPDRIHKVAHAYKSSAAAIGAHGLAELLRQAELAGRANDAERATELLGQVRASHDAVVDHLKSVVQPEA